MVARRPEPAGSRSGAGVEGGGDSYAGGIADCSQSRLRRVNKTPGIMALLQRPCWRRDRIERRLPGQRQRGRYEGDAICFFRGHYAFLQRHLGVALTRQYETAHDPAACRGYSKPQKFLSMQGQPTIGVGGPCWFEPDFDCKDCNKYFLNSDQEEVPRQEGGAEARGRQSTSRPGAEATTTTATTSGQGSLTATCSSVTVTVTHTMDSGCGTTWGVSG